jgi:hypothetical protein
LRHCFIDQILETFFHDVYPSERAMRIFWISLVPS